MVYIRQSDGIPLIEKAPGATLDYIFDWRTYGWLQTGETIVSAVVVVATGLTQPIAAANTSNIVTIWLASGTVGQVYMVLCRVTTSAGRVDERSIRVRVKAR